MALSYRTPTELLINQLPARLTDNLAVKQVDILQSEEDNFGQFLNYSLSKDQRKFLVDKGIYLSPYSWKHHSHPACKTIENWLLYKEIGYHVKHVSKKSTVAFISLREGKLNAIKRIHFDGKEEKKMSEKITSFNRYYCNKDKLRYRNNGDREIIYSSFDQIREKVGTDASYYIHDECHYWSPKDLGAFLEKTRPSSILATVIHPVEYEVGKDTSHLPFLYQFEVENDKLFFFPDGNRSEGYEQPTTAGWWLKMNRFYYDGEVYSITLLRSIGPFHMIYLSKGSLTVESKRFFDDFNILDIPVRFGQNNIVCKANLILRSGFIIKIISYLKSLKRPDRESAVAKLRMMSEEDFSIEELMFVEGLAQTLMSDGYRSIWEQGWSNWIISGLKDCMPDVIHQSIFRQHFKAKENFELLSNLKSLKVVLKTEDYNEKSCTQGKILNMFQNFFTSQGMSTDRICSVIKSNSINDYLGGPNISEYYLEESTNGTKLFHFFDHRYKPIELRTNMLTYEEYINGVVEEKGNDYIYERNVMKLNSKRYEKACKESIKEGLRRSNVYKIFKITEIPEYFRAYNLNNRFVFIDAENFSMSNLYVFLVTGAGSRNKTLKWKTIAVEDEEEAERRKYELKNEFNERYREFEILTNEILSTNNECSTSGSNQSNTLMESNLIDEKTFCNLKNKCCFDSIMQSQSWNYDNLLDAMKNTTYIQKMIEDKGLLVDELVDLIKKLELDLNVIDSSGKLIELCNTKNKVLLLSSNHCKFTTMDNVNHWKLNEHEFMNKILNTNYILKETAVFERANKLYKSIISGSTGVLLCDMFKKNNETERTNRKNRVLEIIKLVFEGEESVYNDCCSSNGPIYGIFGFAGSGKSKGVQDYILNQDKDTSVFTLISPRNDLLMDWKRKIGENRKNVRFLTYEKALSAAYEENELVIVDELSLYPPGYLSLLQVSIKVKTEKISGNVRLSKRNYSNFIGERNVKVIVLGDHMQNRYFNESDVRRLSMTDEIDFIMENEEIVYLNYSLRLCKNHFYRPGVKNYGEGEAKSSRRFQNVYVAKKALPDAQLLVASRDEAIRFKNLDVKTFGESQGLTFDEVIITLSPPAVNCSLQMWNVAMTRARYGVHFALNGFDSVDDFLNKVKGTPMNAMVLGVNFDIHNNVVTKGKNFNLIYVDKMGLNMEEVELKLQGDPFLKSIIPSLDQGLPVEIEYSDIILENPVPKIHLPIESIQGQVAYISSNLKERMQREFIGDGVISEQFPDFWKTGEPGFLLSQSERFQSIFPKHNNSDSLTFFAAVKKRLKFSSPQVERERFEKVRHLGQEMLELFLDKVKISNHHDKLMEVVSYNEYIEKKVSKTGNTIAAHANRSEPDWNLNEIFLFMKTQLCTKYEKRFCDAKAGQTLACFSHVVLNRFAGPTRYIEKKVSKYLPKNFYIHQKKNFDKLSEWVVENGFNGECLESDYEAFDSSQDCLILAFEYELLSYLGWNQGLLDDYLTIKFNLGCRLGNLAVMRFTGEFGTFLFNTLANMTFTFMSYDLGGNEAICFAGDDMCCNRGVKRRTDGRYDHILKRLTLKAKVSYTKEPTFCGWRLTKYGIFKKPEIVLERFLIAIEKGRLKDVIDSYFIECSYAYNLGERLYECFSEKDFIAHYCCVRIVHENSGLLKGISLIKFSEQAGYRLSCSSQMVNNSSKDLTMEKEIQSASRLERCIMMGATPTTLELAQQCVLKALYQSSPLMVKNRSSKGFQSSSPAGSRKKGIKENIKKSMLEQSSLAFINLGIMRVRRTREDAFSLMGVGEARHASSRHLNLIYQKGQPILSWRQMQYLISMMSYSQVPVSSSSSLMMSIIAQELCHLPLKLVQFTECAMHLIVSTPLVYLAGKDQSVTHIRRYMPQRCSTQKMSPSHTMSLRMQESEAESQKLVMNQKFPWKMGEGVHICLGREEGHPHIGNIIWILTKITEMKISIKLGLMMWRLMNDEFLRTYWIVRLSLPLNHLTATAASKRMAAAEAVANQALQDWINAVDGYQGEAYGVRIRKLRRRVLLRTHWVNTIKARVQTLAHANDPQNFGVNDTQKYTRIMNDFASYAFGIIAEEGFSPATMYSEVNTNYRIDYGAPVGEINIEFNPCDIARTFKYYANSSNNNIFNNITWRQIGECFAEDIVRYFKELQPDAQSWLVRSNPVLAGNAPWVALDVTDGLDIRRLNPEEKKVIARAKNHLLKSMQLKGKESLSAEALLES